MQTGLVYATSAPVEEQLMSHALNDSAPQSQTITSLPLQLSQPFSPTVLQGTQHQQTQQVQFHQTAQHRQMNGGLAGLEMVDLGSPAASQPVVLNFQPSVMELVRHLVLESSGPDGLASESHGTEAPSSEMRKPRCKDSPRRQDLEAQMQKLNSEDEDDDDNNCPICLDALDGDATVRTRCGHLFHSHCAQQSEWVSMESKYNWPCPSCREPVTWIRTRGISLEQELNLDTLPDTSPELQLNKLFKRAPTLAGQVDVLLAKSSWILGSKQPDAEGLSPAIVGINVDTAVLESEVKILQEEELEAQRRLERQAAWSRRYANGVPLKHWFVMAMLCVLALAAVLYLTVGTGRNCESLCKCKNPEHEHSRCKQWKAYEEKKAKEAAAEEAENGGN